MIGRPLKAVIPDAERGERGRPRDVAQSSMPRIIAFHPTRFSCWPGIPGSEIILMENYRPSPCRVNCTGMRGARM
jgi:hypothetical protein